MRGLKKQKTRRATAPRNRYVARAKLSEHKFLRILHGYAEGIPIQKLEPRTHVSGKTIRSTYGVLRTTLQEAVQHQPAAFAGVGDYLFDGDGISDNGRQLLGALKASKRFRRYMQRHSPRLRSAAGEGLFLLEKTTRIFCALDLRGVDVDAARMEEISQGILQLRPADPLQRLAEFVADARPHAHPIQRLYEAYRRYLLECPLRTPGK